LEDLTFVQILNEIAESSYLGKKKRGPPSKIIERSLFKKGEINFGPSKKVNGNFLS
jgi:hypothetical protein